MDNNKREPRNARLNARLPQSLSDRLDKYSKQNGITKSEAAVRLLRGALWAVDKGGER